jgi:ataxin-10
VWFDHCRNFKDLSIGCRPEEIVTPHQTTLLKLVDSYLESTPMNTRVAEILKIHESLGTFLLRRFFSLSSYSQQSIAHALGTQPTTTKRKASNSSELMERASIQSIARQPTTTKRKTSTSSEPMERASIRSEPLSASSSSTVFPALPPAELDAQLPKVCEALVLITQCIVTISLEAEEQQMLLQEGRSTLTNFNNMKHFFNKERKSSDQGIVESLIGLYCFSKRDQNFFLQ